MIWTNHYVDFSTAPQRQKLCLAYHLLPQVSFPIPVTPPPCRLLSGPAPAGGSQSPLSPHPFPPPAGSSPAACCMHGPYLYLYHSTHPGWKSCTYSAYCSCCTMNSVRKKKILSFICYSNKQYSSSPVVASVHCSTVSHFLWPQGLSLTRLLCPWDSPGKNTGVGSHFLLQGIFSTQGWNPGLLHCRQILYCLSHQGRFPSSWCSINVCYMISIKCKERERQTERGKERWRMCLFSLEKRRCKGLTNLVKDIDSLWRAPGYQLDLHWSRLTSWWISAPIAIFP